MVATRHSIGSTRPVAAVLVQVLGGNGYVNDYPTGRILRDAKLYEIGAGALGRNVPAQPVLAVSASWPALMFQGSPDCVFQTAPAEDCAGTGLHLPCHYHSGLSLQYRLSAAASLSLARREPLV